MGFFSNSNSVTSTANIEDLLREDNLEIYEGMSIMEANYAAMAVTEMNWNAIMEAAAITEMEYYAEHGEEYVYTEASGFFGKVADFFKKIWEKVKALFKKFMVIIGGLISKDKDFVKKYRETIIRNIKNIPSDATMKGYNFTTSKGASVAKSYNNIADCINDLSTAVTKYLNNNGYTTESLLDPSSWDSTKAAEICRGEVVKTGKEFDDKDFKEYVFAALRNGENSPIEVKITDNAVTEALRNLEGGKKAKDDAKKAYSTSEKNFKDIIKNAEDMQKNWYKKDSNKTADEINRLNNAIACAKNIATYGQTMAAMLLTAVKDEYNQYKRMCVRVATYKTKGVNEGATIEHFSEGDAFAELNLI